MEYILWVTRKNYSECNRGHRDLNSVAAMRTMNKDSDCRNDHDEYQEAI